LNIFDTAPPRAHQNPSQHTEKALHAMVTIEFEVVRLLTQVGLLSSWAGLHDEAQCILQAAAEQAPTVAQIRNCQALALFAAGRHDEAVAMLNATVEDFPTDDMARATLAFVLKQLNRPGWSLLARSVDRDAQQPEAQWLARHTLGLDPQPSAAARAHQVVLAGGTA
jgi:Flp pilus assembly protein TadD